MRAYSLLSFGLCIPLSTILAGCNLTPQQINAAATLNCALAADGSTVVAVLKPGYAAPANAASVVGCAAGQQIGAALAASK